MLIFGAWGRGLVLKHYRVCNAYNHNAIDRTEQWIIVFFTSNNERIVYVRLFIVCTMYPMAIS